MTEEELESLVDQYGQEVKDLYFEQISLPRIRAYVAQQYPASSSERLDQVAREVCSYCKEHNEGWERACIALYGA